MLYEGKKMNRLAFLRLRVEEERRWLAEHGSDLNGYLIRYGSRDYEGHYGDGGEAIYAADVGALARAERALWHYRQFGTRGPRR